MHPNNITARGIHIDSARDWASGDLDFICAALTNHACAWQSITIRGCQLDDADACRFADALQSNMSVSSIDFRGNNIGDTGCAALVDVSVKASGRISWLNLHDNDISVNGARLLTRKRIQTGIEMHGDAPDEDYEREEEYERRQIMLVQLLQKKNHHS